MIETAGIIGLGRAGSSLAATLAQTSCRVELMVDPHPRGRIGAVPVISSLQDVTQPVDLLLVCVPDRKLAEVLQEISLHQQLRQSTVLHLSGAANLIPFSALQAGSFKGCGMLHPLYSFPENPVALPEQLLFAVNGDERGLATAREVATLLRGRSVTIQEESSALYHLLAVMVSNFPQALSMLAADLAEEVTADSSERQLLQEGLQALLLQSVGKLEAGSPQTGLTGPARRGDLSTMRSHLDELSSRDQNLMDLYLRFSQIILHRFADELPESRYRECLQLLEENESV